MADRGKYQVFPDMVGESWERFKAHLSQFGLQTEIVKDEQGDILDGHQRERGCREAGVEPRYREMCGLTEDGKWEFVIGANEHRRHMTTDEQRTVMVEMRQKGLTQIRIAELLGTDQGTVSRGLKAKRAQGATLPEQIRTADGRKYPGQRKAPGARDRRGPAEAPGSAQTSVVSDGDNRADEGCAPGPLEITQEADGHVLLKGEIEAVEEHVPAASVRAVVYLDCLLEVDAEALRRVAHLAARVLRPDGVLVVACNTWTARAVLAAVDPAIPFRSLLGMPHAESMEGVTGRFDPILIFGGKEATVWEAWDERVHAQQALNLLGDFTAGLTDPGDSMLVLEINLSMSGEAYDEAREMGRQLVLAKCPYRPVWMQAADE